MNPKYDKLCADLIKAEKKFEDLQAQIKEMREKKTEMENLEIINTVRAMVMDKIRLWLFSPLCRAAMRSSRSPCSRITRKRR